MSFWDHWSIVSKETIFRKCTYFSDFYPFWKTFSDDNFQKLKWQSDSWEWQNVFFTPAIRSKKKQVHEWFFDKFLWIVIWKIFLKNGKNHWNWCIFMKMLPWILHSNYFKSAFKDLRRLSYQMDHIWVAPSLLKEALLLIFLEKLAIILRQDFLKTL